LINDSDPFRPSGLSGFQPLWQLRQIQCFQLSSGLRASALREFLSISHFKSPEAHFPEGLDRLPPVPFKINNSYSLRGLFLWRYTSHKFSLPNAHESLIWTALGIFVVERLKLPFAYASILKQTVKKVALCVHGCGLHDRGFGDGELRK
jgi:hypothetical protein